MYGDEREDEFWDLSGYVKKSEPSKTCGEMQRREARLAEVHFSANEKTLKSDGYAPIALPSRGGYGIPVRPRDEITHTESYVPSHPLLLSVSIAHKSSDQSFYRLFREDARRYHGERGKAPCAPYVPFFSYVPQFSQLLSSQRAYYLYFRDELERGGAPRADEAYFMLYVYELLNLTDVIEPRTVCSRLAFAWCTYRDSFPRMDKYLAQWIFDLCLLYRLPPPTAELSSILPHVLRASTVPEFYLGDVTGDNGGSVSALALSLSSYDYRAHKCGKEHAELFDTHMTAAMRQVLPLLLDAEKKEARDEVRHLAFTAFGGSICAHNLRAQIELDYRPFGLSHTLGACVTAAIKYVENALRAHLCIRNRLRITELAPAVQSVLDGYIASALPKKTKVSAKAPDDTPYRALYEASEVGISFSRADEIEQSSWDNARLLGAEEELPCETVQVPCEQRAVSSEDETVLSSDAVRYLAALLECKEKVTHEARLVEEVNAYAELQLGDVLLLPSASVFGAFELIEDYREDAEKWIREKSE